jgi:hypothetical protein
VPEGRRKRPYSTQLPTVARSVLRGRTGRRLEVSSTSDHESRSDIVLLSVADERPLLPCLKKLRRLVETRKGEGRQANSSLTVDFGIPIAVLAALVTAATTLRIARSRPKLTTDLRWTDD